METSTLALAVTGLLILIALGFFFYFVPVGLWITAIFSGVGRAGHADRHAAAQGQPRRHRAPLHQRQ